MKNLSAFVLGTSLLVMGFLSAAAEDGDAASAVRTGQLDEPALGQLLSSMGLKPKQAAQRFDFGFSDVHGGEQWRYSMSAVLSQNRESIWIMAWLDQLPEHSDDVSREALLQLLSANDRLGDGKFFAYLPTHRRFVMQRVIPNRDLDQRQFRSVLRDLAGSVTAEHSAWSVASWGKPGGTSNATAVSAETIQPVESAEAKAEIPPSLRTSDSATRFDPARIH